MFLFQTKCGHEIIENLLPNMTYAIVLKSHTIKADKSLVSRDSEIVRINTRISSTRLSPVQNFTFIEYTLANNTLDLSVQWDSTNGKFISY